MPRVLAGMGPLGPRGPEGGPPALVVPGFMASDRATMELRRGLARGGFRVHPWEMGLNKGAKIDTLVRLKARLDAVADKRKVLLVGWSLGGLYARELARAHPDMVRAARGIDGERDKAVEIDTSHMGFAVSRAALEQVNREIATFLEEFPAT